MRVTAERGLWGVAASLGTTAVFLMLSATGGVDAMSWQMRPAQAAIAPARSDLGEVAMQVIANDPFRLDRRPAELPFGTAPRSAEALARPTEVAPTVSGIVGPPWRAVLEGIRGREGSILVAKGDTVGGYRIVSLSTDTVVIQAKDTTWRLSVRKAW